MRHLHPSKVFPLKHLHTCVPKRGGVSPHTKSIVSTTSSSSVFPSFVLTAWRVLRYDGWQEWGWLILIPLRNPWSWPLLEVLFRIWGTGASSPPISRFRKSLTQHSVMLLLTRIMTTLEMASWGARKASLCHSQTSRIIDCFLCLESNQHHQATQVYTCLFPL